MNRHKAISDRLLLGAIFLGLNLLCFLGILHGQHVFQHTRLNYSHIPVHSTRRAGSSRSESESSATVVVAHFDHSFADHAPKVMLSQGHPGAGTHIQGAIATAMLRLVRPDGLTEPLADQNVIALGAAPRAPGLGRAPPIAA
ncbi:MAG: hypothetical protein PW789_11575 [Edaphobacter sp.]|uniref:hypothetical protein n=1 Tax=Edaphobacter sp. TaxID=1934404 RepID=UPI00239B10BF|nr:hypothetical protein [Edaphobacter sp.]MDE1177225.1 hypothetical protein [Edaphobacter sp.]